MSQRVKRWDGEKRLLSSTQFGPGTLTNAPDPKPLVATFWL